MRPLDYPLHLHQGRYARAQAAVWIPCRIGYHPLHAFRVTALQDLATAVREAREEIGLSLDDQRSFEFVGQLDDRMASRGGRWGDHHHHTRSQGTGRGRIKVCKRALRAAYAPERAENHLPIRTTNQ